MHGKAAPKKIQQHFQQLDETFANHVLLVISFIFAHTLAWIAKTDQQIQTNLKQASQKRSKSTLKTQLTTQPVESTQSIQKNNAFSKIRRCTPHLYKALSTLLTNVGLTELSSIFLYANTRNNVQHCLMIKNICFLAGLCLSLKLIVEEQLKPALQRRLFRAHLTTHPQTKPNH